MFVVDRPQFDRHPSVPHATRLLCGGRVVVNCLEATHWAAGRFGGCGDHAEYFWYEPGWYADVVRLGDAIAVVQATEDWVWTVLSEVILIPAAAWEVVREAPLQRHHWSGEAHDTPPPAAAFPPPTRAQLAAAWLLESPYAVRQNQDRREPTTPEYLPRVLRRAALAADPGELPAALAAVDRVLAWAAAEPDAPAPGTLHPPGDAGPALTFYLDDEGFPEWPALTVDGAGLLLDGWAFRPAE